MIGILIQPARDHSNHGPALKNLQNEDPEGMLEISDGITRATRIGKHGPEQCARVFDEAAFLDGEAVLPGFRLPVSDLFRNVPRS